MTQWTIAPVFHLTTIGIYHLAVFGALVPFLAYRSYQRIKAAPSAALNRLKHFRGTALMLILFGALSLITARAQDLDLFAWDARRALIGLPAGAAMYVIAVGAMRPRWRKAVERRARIVHLFMPATAIERAWWLCVSILAGVSEEITWRGVQTSLLAAAVGSPALAVALCAIMFGLAHMVQGWKSSAVIVIFAFGFHGLVWLTGSLYVPMAVHVVYDITAGLTYAKFGRELGYSLDQPAAATTGPEGPTGPR